jgi:hypothetical protein
MAKIINTRSPFYIKAEDTDLSTAVLKLYIIEGDFKDKTSSDLKYTISKSTLSGKDYVVFEISELVRDYLDIEFNGNYIDQAIWVNYEIELKDQSNSLLYSDQDLLLGVDGYTYFEQGANVQSNLLDNISRLNSWFKIGMLVEENEDPGLFDLFNDAAFLEATSTGDSFISDSFTKTGKLTFSVYADTQTNSDFIVLRKTYVSDNNYAFFNINNGTIGTVSGSDILDARISRYGAFYKCEIDLDISASETGSKNAYIYLADSDGSFSSATGNVIKVCFPRLEETTAKHKRKETLLQSNKTIFRLDDYNVRVPIYTRNTTSVAYRYQGITKRSETISPSDDINDIANNKFQIDYISVSGSDNVDTYEQRVLADGGTLEISKCLDEFLSSVDIGIVDELYVSSDTSTEVIKIKTLECSKYEPIKVTFVNKFGALQDIFFTLKSIESTNVKSESFKRSVFNQDTLSYNTSQHQNQLFHTNANDKIVLNTDYLNEDYNEVIEQLMISEKTWMTRIIDNEQLVLPIVPSTKSITYKTSVNDRLIQYTIGFDMAFDKINNIR